MYICKPYIIHCDFENKHILIFFVKIQHPTMLKRLGNGVCSNNVHTATCS